MLFQYTKRVVGVGTSSDEATFSYSLVSAATANATLIKSSAGVITSISAFCQVANVRYLKLYDTATAPVAGQSTPYRRYAIPGSATGAGFILNPCVPLKFLNGIGFTVVAGTGLDSDTTAVGAGDVILTIEYL